MRMFPRILSLLLLVGAGASHAQVERISVTDDEQQATGGSFAPVVSADGSVIAFRSSAANLVAGDTNDLPDVFVRDLAAGTTVLASLRPDGQPAGDFSKRPSISDDGRLVAFEAKHPNSSVLVTALRDRALGTTEYLVPNTSSGNPSAPLIARLQGAVSADGSSIAFVTRDSLQNAFPASIRPINDDSNLTFDVFVYDHATQPTPAIERVSRSTPSQELDADSRSPSISGDGSMVAFESFSELVPGDDNNAPDVVARDRLTNTLELISIALDATSGNGPSFAPSISGEGRFIAFRSAASDLVAGDTNSRHDVFVRDRTAGTTVRVSVATGGDQADGHSMDPSISSDGRFVAFRSTATNLVAGDTNGRSDIFVHDRVTSETARVGEPSGGQSNGTSAAPSLSGNGAWIVFESDATNLVAGDTNDSRDIFRAANPLWSTP